MSDLFPGWEPLLDRLCDRLEAAGWDRRFSQVKEKFGTLRIYFEEDNRPFTRLAEECEDASQDICAYCGGQGRVVDLYGYCLTLCTRCADTERAARAQRNRDRA